MESYHNAVSDRLIITHFEQSTLCQVFKKDNQIKWSTVSTDFVIPQEIQGAIFTSSTLIVSNFNFTLAPLQVEDYASFYELNFNESTPVTCFDTEEFTVVSQEAILASSASKSLAGLQTKSDIQLVYAYAAAKAKQQAIFFYKQAGKITILAWKEGKFLLANRYPADNLDEVFYYIMLVVEQLDLQPADVYFEVICSKGQHESYHSLFKNYLAPLHLSSDVLSYQSIATSDDAEAHCLAHFFAQCVL